jgi:hypothetical protein
VTFPEIESGSRIVPFLTRSVSWYPQRIVWNVSSSLRRILCVINKRFKATTSAVNNIKKMQPDIRVHKCVILPRKHVLKHFYRYIIQSKTLKRQVYLIYFLNRSMRMSHECTKQFRWLSRSVTIPKTGAVSLQGSLKLSSASRRKC